MTIQSCVAYTSCRCRFPLFSFALPVVPRPVLCVCGVCVSVCFHHLQAYTYDAHTRSCKSLSCMCVKRNRIGPPVRVARFHTHTHTHCMYSHHPLTSLAPSPPPSQLSPPPRSVKQNHKQGRKEYRGVQAGVRGRIMSGFGTDNGR